MRRRLMALLLLCVATPGLAHKASDAYLTLARDAEPSVLRVDLALRDLEMAVGLDVDHDGRISWGELRARREAIVALVRGGIELRAGSTPCSLGAPRLAVADHTDGSYAVLGFAVSCPQGGTADTMSYRLLFERDPLHRGLLAIEDTDGRRTTIFSPAQSVRSLGAASTGPWTTIRDFVAEGAWHIWIGFDHLLFLAVLLLPAALTAGGKPGRLTLDVVKVVTAFTLAHSITLGLAVLGYIELPSRWVESGIALSIVLAALANLHPRGLRIGWLLAFGFGLVHGLGFAGVLAGLQLDGTALAFALLGFNLGVEAGQLAIVLAVLPVLFVLSRTPRYRSVVLPAGSLAAAAIGALWLFERMG